MRRYTPRQTAVMVSATTLALLGSSPIAALAKDSNRRESSAESEHRIPKVEVRHSEADDQHNDEHSDDHQQPGTSTPGAPAPATTSVPQTVPPTAPPTVPPVTTPPTTAPPTTPPTTKPSTPTTTKPIPPAPTIRVSQTFLATKVGAPIRMDTTVTNDAAKAGAVSVLITMSSTGALPGYLEAKALTGTWTCSAYAAKPVSPQQYTCTGNLAAKSSGVITVSSGSSIAGPAGQMVIAGVVVNPGGVASGATATSS